MRLLIVGAAGQDKASFAAGCLDVLDNAHIVIRGMMKAGNSHEEILAVLLAHEAVVCDEIGGGVVPVDAFERLWREESGRLCCDLARHAATVVRVVCGLPQTLKGELKWK